MSERERERERERGKEIEREGPKVGVGEYFKQMNLSERKEKLRG